MTARAGRGGVVLLLALGSPLTPAAPGAPVDDGIAYTVRAGDTLIGLARRLLIDPAAWRELARANGLRDPDRIAVGRTLRLPVALLRSEAEPARVVSASGDARAAGTPGPLAVGQPLAEGTALDTGPGGQLTVRLVDGTLLRLRAGSRLELTESRRLPAFGATRSATRLDSGRVEVEAAHPAAGQPGFRVRTPQGVLAVRGTEFRVESDTARAVTRGEVLQGTVAFGGEPVAAGYGSVIDADGRVAAAAPLLAAPDLRTLPVLQERVLLRFRLPATDGARSWRGQIARDAGFDAVVADQVAMTPELRFTDLPDGDYLLRVRAIDAAGLEGRDADLRFRLKARPEPPLLVSPAPGAVLSGGAVAFEWADNGEAARYRLQLAGPAGFDAPVRDLPDIHSNAATVDGLSPGRYHWRVRSLRADGDAGPWGDARDVELRPLPPVPPPPRLGDRGLHFAWAGEPGQRFDFQLARDPAFTRELVARELDAPELDLPPPGGGRFWIRLRAHDPDGYLGPWTAPQRLDLPHCLHDAGGGCVRSGEGPVDLMP